jgi:hypothetical protein
MDLLRLEAAREGKNSARGFLQYLFEEGRAVGKESRSERRMKQHHNGLVYVFGR